MSLELASGIIHVLMDRHGISGDELLKFHGIWQQLAEQDLVSGSFEVEFQGQLEAWARAGKPDDILAFIVGLGARH